MSAIRDFEKDCEGQISELRARANTELSMILREFFGTATVRNLSALELEELESFIFRLSEDVKQVVASHALRQMSDDSMAATWNVFRGVIAGGAAMKRDLTGEEPSAFERRLVFGSEGSAEGDSVSADVPEAASTP